MFPPFSAQAHFGFYLFPLYWFEILFYFGNICNVAHEWQNAYDFHFLIQVTDVYHQNTDSVYLFVDFKNLLYPTFL